MVKRPAIVSQSEATRYMKAVKTAGYGDPAANAAEILAAQERE